MPSMTRPVGGVPADGGRRARDRSEVVGAFVGQGGQHLVGTRADDRDLLRSVVVVPDHDEAAVGGEGAGRVEPARPRLRGRGQLLGGDRRRQRSLPGVGDPGHAVQVALADVAEPGSVDPLDRGDVGPGGVHGAPGAGDQVEQDQVAGHDPPVAAGGLDHGGPRSVGRPGGQPELDVAAQQLGQLAGREVEPAEHGGVPVVLAGLLAGDGQHVSGAGPGRLPDVQPVGRGLGQLAGGRGVEPQGAPGVLGRPGLDLGVPGRQPGLARAGRARALGVGHLRSEPGHPEQDPGAVRRPGQVLDRAGDRGRRPGLAELVVGQQVELEHLGLGPVGQEGQG